MLDRHGGRSSVG